MADAKTRDERKALSPKGALQSDDMIVEMTAPGTAGEPEHTEPAPLHALAMSEVMKMSVAQRLVYWKKRPAQGYAFLDTDGNPRNPWLFGIDIPIRRSLVLVAGVCTHLCIGSIFSFSIFNDPIQKEGEGVRQNWQNPGLVFALAVFTMGMSCLYTGSYLESHGPRATGTYSAILFGMAHWLAALAVHYDLEILMFLGFGVVGGVGLAFGYVTPVSPMVKWFPDARGVASGLAVMGFGLGAFIGSKQNTAFIEAYGVENTFWIAGFIYFVVQLVCAQYLCKPPVGWTPPGFEYETQAKKIREGMNLTLRETGRTPHFILCWITLFCSCLVGVSAFSQAKPMQTDIYGAGSSTADWMISIWALCNCLGRLGWASVSDRLTARGLSRKYMYVFFCVVQGVLVISIPSLTSDKDTYPVYCIFIGIITSMYGGVFGTVPAFLADLFGPENVGAVHGAVLTAWGMGGGAGSFVITVIKEKRKDDGAEGKELYDPFFYFGFAVLMMGVCSAALVRPLIDKRGHIRMSLGWINTWKRKWNRRFGSAAAQEQASAQV